MVDFGLLYATGAVGSIDFDVINKKSLYILFGYLQYDKYKRRCQYIYK